MMSDTRRAVSRDRVGHEAAAGDGERRGVTGRRHGQQRRRTARLGQGLSGAQQNLLAEKPGLESRMQKLKALPKLGGWTPTTL